MKALLLLLLVPTLCLAEDDTVKDDFDRVVAEYQKTEPSPDLLTTKFNFSYDMRCAQRSISGSGSVSYAVTDAYGNFNEKQDPVRGPYVYAFVNDRELRNILAHPSLRANEDKDVTATSLPDAEEEYSFTLRRGAKDSKVDLFFHYRYKYRNRVNETYCYSAK
ncbi:hypothetical protein K2X33_05325 [bacterium]|nr:hypothetical protein [bacterium]